MADSEDLKACCVAAYSSDAVALLLGDSYHPGGTALTRRLADALGLIPGSRVLDIVSGRGTTEKPKRLDDGLPPLAAPA
jgi:arsenite methyltransferase